MEAVVVYADDTTEWRVVLVKEHVVYSDAVAVDIQSPYRLPTREDAQVLKSCSFPSEERFVTSDGYTFGMPSASVTKAGAKTKYSVIGLHVRRTVIVYDF